MEVANELLRNWKEINRGKQHPRTSRPSPREISDGLESRVERMGLEAEHDEFKTGHDASPRFEEISGIDSVSQSQDSYVEAPTDQYQELLEWNDQDYGIKQAVRGNC